jgi:hypothetical protein
MSVSAIECPGISANERPRVQIPIFQYSGAEQGDAKNQFSLYQGIIRVKLSTLIGEIQPPIGKRDQATGQLDVPVQALEYLENVGVHMPSGSPIKDTLTTVQLKKIYWDQTNALELLRGTLWPGNPYFVDSEIYIGDLRGEYPRGEIRARLLLEPERVPSTNDTHSLVTYYALAMDARRLECDPAIVRDLLSRAMSILQDLRGREDQVVGDLAELEVALKQELEGAAGPEVRQ